MCLVFLVVCGLGMVIWWFLGFAFGFGVSYGVYLGCFVYGLVGFACYCGC